MRGPVEDRTRGVKETKKNFLGPKCAPPLFYIHAGPCILHAAARDAVSNFVT